MYIVVRSAALIFTVSKFPFTSSPLYTACRFVGPVQPMNVRYFDTSELLLLSYSEM